MKKGSKNLNRDSTPRSAAPSTPLAASSPSIQLDAYEAALRTIDEQRSEIERLKAAAADDPSADGAAVAVKPHLRCPACWNGLGGRAAREKWHRQVSGSLQQRAYVCDTCGAEWTVQVRAEVKDNITHRTTAVVEVRTNSPQPN